jgi:CRP-like cAMP-binding protein
MLSGETMMQVPDTSIEVLSVEIFRRELARRGAFFECIQRYAQGYLLLMMQSVACMARHPVQERCCRWLLMTHDRLRRDDFQLSHEFLAMMLGSTRPTVTVVAGTLQKAGLITYVHGHTTILDRAALEGASCECYSTVRQHFDRLGL